MSPTSSPDQVTTVFESGNWDAENRGASLPGCEPSLATPMGNTQPPYLMTEQFESGTLRLMLHMANLYIKEHRILVLAVPYANHRQHMASGSADKSIQVWDPLPHFPIPRPLVNQFMLVLVDSQTQSVGSEDQKVVCFIE